MKATRKKENEKVRKREKQFTATIYGVLGFIISYTRTKRLSGATFGRYAITQKQVIATVYV